MSDFKYLFRINYDLLTWCYKVTGVENSIVPIITICYVQANKQVSFDYLKNKKMKKNLYTKIK